MGSKGVERRKQATPGQTPEGNVVMSFSFESYQLEEEDCQVKDISDKGVLALSEPGESLLHMMCLNITTKCHLSHYFICVVLQCVIIQILVWQRLALV